MNLTTENIENQAKKNKQKNKIYLQVRDSTKCCNEALITNPKNINTFYVLGKCLIQQENFGMTKDVIEKIRNINPNSVYCNILEGHLYLKNGQIRESYNEFVMAYFELGNQDVYLSYGLGLFYDILEKYELSRKWFTSILSTDIELFKYLEIMFRIGVCYKKERQFFDALGVFKSLESFIKTDLFKDYVRLQMAHIYELMNETEACMNILNKLKSSKQIIILVNRLYTWIHYKNKNYELIKNQFKCQKERNSRKNTDFSLTELEKEFNYCDCSVISETNDQYILYLLGRVLAEEERNEEALEIFMMCTKLDSMSYMAYNSAGIINYKLKRYEVASSFFKQTLMIKPYFTDALNSFKVVECKLRNIPCNQTIYESNPDIFMTRYLDSQTIFNESIFFANTGDTLHIKDLDPYNLKND